MAHSMCLLASLGSYEKSFKVSQVGRSTNTHQSGLLIEGFLLKWLGRETTGLCHDESVLPWIWRSLMAHSMCLLASLGSYEKSFKVSQAGRSTNTHQSGLLIEGS